MGNPSPQCRQTHRDEVREPGSSETGVSSTSGWCWRALLRKRIFSSGGISSNRMGSPMRPTLPPTHQAVAPPALTVPAETHFRPEAVRRIQSPRFGHDTLSARV